MNYLKKKLKPLTTGLTNAATNVTAATGAGSSSGRHNHNNRHNFDKDLEDDLYDEYVVEAPPHPSELLALGVDPTDIDVNNPEKLKELYRKAKEEGKDKKTNSVLLARQRQKEEIEEKKKTREEWKFFDSITARVEQAVKDSQKTLEQLKESSAIDKLTEPEYELKLSADEVFKSSQSVKTEKSAENWINFNEEDSSAAGKEKKPPKEHQLLDDFGCAIERRRSSVQQVSSRKASAAAVDNSNFVVEELLKDFGIDLRPADERKISEEPKKREQVVEAPGSSESSKPPKAEPKKLDIDLRVAARPRPRPTTAKTEQPAAPEEDPFDTSFVAEPVLFDEQGEKQLLGEEDPFDQPASASAKQQIEEPARLLDPFDTSYVNL